MMDVAQRELLKERVEDILNKSRISREIDSNVVIDILTKHNFKKEFIERLLEGPYYNKVTGHKFTLIREYNFISIRFSQYTDIQNIGSYYCPIINWNIKVHAPDKMEIKRYSYLDEIIIYTKEFTGGIYNEETN